MIYCSRYLFQYLDLKRLKNAQFVLC